ncbi:hypothetical protein EYR41_001695 [Orbilia oligospora]|uniref:Uncharacterized protein n=1 Tax=Orbilia oligospora TaxID=2813651 RepID=A0A7C8JWT2_ORBOL|nr:hypothetical protein TWF751_004748 [Orbilia oligospora]KAF3256719.1 hypothetical protein TWF128_005230 [Orbilia oligospora]KAF3256720.1 hypothetical protein TWF128_005230 [Orbilia oligospora]TGJ74727.1 hypothetical protein EYR41_001695 [Orbilia oligospora]
MPTRKDPLSAVPATPTRQSSDPPAVIPSPERKGSLSSNSTSNSAPPTPTIKQQSHICQSCGRGFSRAEHLDRHLATHLPPSEAKTYICTLCTKGFTRKDVLSRHIKAVHQTKKIEVKKSRRRSCIRCAGFKIKCSSGASKGRTVVAPCDACARRGHECVFDADSDLIVIRRESLNDPTEADINDEDDDDVDDDDDDMNAMDLMETMETSDSMDSAPQPLKLGELETREPSLKRRRTIDEGQPSAFQIDHRSMKSIDSGIGTSSGRSSSLGSTATIFSKQESMNAGSTYPHYNPNLPGFGGAPPPVNYSHYFGSGRGSSSSTSLSSSPSFTSFPHAQLPRGYVERDSRKSSGWPGLSQDEYMAADALNGMVPGGRPYDSFSYFDSMKKSLGSGSSSRYGSREPAMLSSLQLFQKLDDPAENWFFDPSIFEFDFLREDFSLHSIPEELPFSRPEKAPHAYLNPSVLTLSKSPSLNTSFPSSSWGASSSQHSPQDQSPSGIEGPRYQQEIRLPHVGSAPPYLAEDSLPWDWQSSSHREPRIILPPLRELLQAPQQGFHRQAGLQRSHEIPSGRDRQSPKETIISDQVRKDMLTILKAPYERLPHNNVDLRDEKFPSNEVLNEFVQLYLRHFHAVLPMLHIPTFTTDSCPNFLLITIATIGARYHTSEHAIEFADNLNALCYKALNWLGEYNEDYKQSASYLMAFCLQSVYALGAGNKRLFEMADATRSYMINACRNLGLFTTPGGRSPRPRPKPTTEDPFLPSTDLSDLEKIQQHWLDWREEEFKKRLAWCIFECDCAISVLTNRRGNIALTDLCLPLPCEEVLWEAPDSQAWAALYPRHKSIPPRGMPFYFVLRDILNGHQDQLSLSAWGRRLCAQGISRMIWDIREIETSPLGRIVQLPVLSVGLKPAKDDLLKASMILLNSTPNDDTKYVDSSITAIVVHYAHLYATRDVVDLAISLAKHSATGKFVERMERINRIKNIFTSDMVNARELAWHAGQILAAGRRYNLHTSSDCLRVFIAGVYLHAFAKYFPTTQYLSSVTEEHSAAPPDDAVRLDSLCSSNNDSINYWIKHGGKARLERIGDLHSIEGAREVLRLVESLLQRMKLWGICDKFLKVVQEILHED